MHSAPTCSAQKQSCLKPEQAQPSIQSNNNSVSFKQVVCVTSKQEAFIFLTGVYRVDYMN